MSAPDITKISDLTLATWLHAEYLGTSTNHAYLDLGNRPELFDPLLRVARYVRTLLPPAAQPVARVPVAMTDNQENLTVACNDGTVWTLSDDGTKWTDFPRIPQPTPVPSQAETPPYGGWEAGAAPVDAVASDPMASAAPELLRIAKWALQILNARAGNADFRADAADIIARAEGRT